MISISSCFHLLPSIITLQAYYTNLIEGRRLIHIDTEGDQKQSKHSSEY